MQTEGSRNRADRGARPGDAVRGYAAMNTVRALEHLAFTALSTSELADSLQISVRTARRLMQRLELEGFVTQEGGHRRRYHATLRLAVLGRQMLDHAPLAQSAAPYVTQLAQDTANDAHLWIAGYDEQVVCAVHADGHPAGPTVSILYHVASAPSSAAGTVLLRDRARLRSSCYLYASSEPTFAAAVLEHGLVVGALGLSGDNALAACRAVVTAATRLSSALTSRAWRSRCSS